MHARGFLGSAAGHRRAGGHERVGLVDERPHLQAVGIARAWQTDRQFGAHAAGVRREDQDAVGHQHGFLDVVRHDEHGLGRHLTATPELRGCRRAGARR